MNRISVNAERIAELTADLNTSDFLREVLNFFAEGIALSSSFGAEDQVLLDMIFKIRPGTKVFTLDTGRLADETYDVIEKSRTKYGISVEVLYPDARELQHMVTLHGPNLFFKSVELRKRCCEVRKIGPLKRKLSGLDAWICGLRSQQSQTRGNLKRIQHDNAFGLIKVSPLLDWTTRQVWDYIRENDVPYNRLHDEGYPSIGCNCCTRAVKPGEDIRAGRWWWELPEHKECGIHLQPAVKKQ